MKNFNMKNITGMDANIEISLFEYGFAWITSNDGKEIMFYYGIQSQNYDVRIVTGKQIGRAHV